MKLKPVVSITHFDSNIIEKWITSGYSLLLCSRKIVGVLPKSKQYKNLYVLFPPDMRKYHGTSIKLDAPMNVNVLFTEYQNRCFTNPL